MSFKTAIIVYLIGIFVYTAIGFLSWKYAFNKVDKKIRNIVEKQDYYYNITIVDSGKCYNNDKSYNVIIVIKEPDRSKYFDILRKYGLQYIGIDNKFNDIFSGTICKKNIINNEYLSKIFNFKKEIQKTKE